jgi:peptidoglycan/LPS O-acetylase OafA/YrhL
MHHRPALAVTAPPGDRLVELDALRGLAAFAVLLHHAVQLLPPVATPDLPGAALARYTLLHLTPLRMIEYGRPAVLFFFVLSGYVLARALIAGGSPGLRAFAAQRSLRLGLPVATSVLLSVVLYLAFADPALPEALRPRSLYTWLEPPTAMQAAGNALLLSTEDHMRLNIVLWSLVHEWRLTVLLPLVLAFRGRVPLFLALVLGLMALGLLGGAQEDRVMLGARFHSTVAATLYFAGGIGSGVALALACPRGLPRLAGAQGWAAAIACLALFSMSSDIAVYAGSVLLILLASQPGRLRGWLRAAPLAGLGRISFSLYLVHAPVLVACLHALHGAWPPAAILAFGLAAAMLVAVAFNLLVEAPSRRLARRVERRLADRAWRPRAPMRMAAAPVRDWAPEGGMPHAVG